MNAIAKPIYNEVKMHRDAMLYLRGKDRMKEISDNDIKTIRDITSKAFTMLEKAVKIEFVTGQPYENHKQIIADFATGKMLISTDFNDSELFGETANLHFRAIHDFYHAILNEPFGYTGEANVYELQKLLYPAKYWKVLYSEIVLQTAYYEYYGHFPEQKIVY